MGGGSSSGTGDQVDLKVAMVQAIRPMVCKRRREIVVISGRARGCDAADWERECGGDMVSIGISPTHTQNIYP